MRALFLSTHEQRDQRVRPHLAAGMAMQLRVKGRALGQGVGRVEVIARAEDARRTILQKDFHLPLQHKQPLRRTRAMEVTAKAHRTLAQLVTP